jgi:hypothetical protein
MQFAVRQSRVRPAQSTALGRQPLTSCLRSPTDRRPEIRPVTIALFVASCVLLLHVISVRAAEPTGFVGAGTCGGCHAAETALW